MTQPTHNTISPAVFRSAWRDFLRTDEGRQEYVHRYIDHLFVSPPREIPRELLSLPPHHVRPSVRRQRAARKASIRSLIAAAEKAGKTVTSATMPDGTVLHFGEPAPMTTAVNSWTPAIADLEAKVKGRRH